MANMTRPCWPIWPKRRLRAKIPELTEALTGRFTDHHAFLTGMYLESIDQRSRQIVELTARIEVVIEPFRSFWT